MAALRMPGLAQRFIVASSLEGQMNLRDCLDHPAIGNAAAVAGRCDAGERVAQRCKPCDAGFDIGKVPPRNSGRFGAVSFRLVRKRQQ